MSAEQNNQPKPKIKEPQKPPPVTEQIATEWGGLANGRVSSISDSPSPQLNRAKRLSPAASVFTQIAMRQMVGDGIMNLPGERSARPLRQATVLQMQQWQGNTAVQRALINHYVSGTRLNMVQRDLPEEIPADRVRTLLDTTLARPPGEGRETTRPDTVLIREVDRAVWGLYGSYFTRAEHLTEPGVVRMLNLEEFVAARDESQTERGQTTLSEQMASQTQAEIERLVAAGGRPPWAVTNFVTAAQSHQLDGLNAAQPWRSTGAALAAWRRWMSHLAMATARTYGGRAEMGVGEGFTEMSSSGSGESTQISVLSESPALVGSLAHEAIHFYSSPAFFRTAIRTAVDTVLSGPSGSSVPEEEVGQHSRFRRADQVLREGTTQYFTLQLLTEGYLQFEHPHTAYDDAVREVTQMAEYYGEETLRRAYFGGDTTAMQQLGMMTEE
ncbi:MAG: hypothetical protein GY796_03520 [Chloroflexi bacterium]|nr:hypothetical protein [Chloroflexota bacterium]